MIKEYKSIDTFQEVLFSKMNEAKSIAISGHVRPDGDCLGACLGMYHYIQSKYKEEQKQVDVYLESVPESFEYLLGNAKVRTSITESKNYDLFISLDCGSLDRLGFSEELFQNAKETICIDHHISNTLFADCNYVEGEASSTCEILTALIDESDLNLEIANAFYTGIVHDTGVFKHSNTKRRTMELAGRLINQGVNTSKIIDGSFYQKTYMQNQILGRSLLESMLVLDGRCICCSISRKQMDFYQAKPHDLDGIIDQLRVTKGVEVAILIYELASKEFKVSMRSNEIVDVCAIAQYFGGGGHIRAAGCTMKGSAHDVINNITLHIENQLKNADRVRE